MDPGRVGFFLDIHNPNQLATHPLRGALFESFIVAELLKKRFNAVQTDNLFYFRDNIGNEVDIIWDRSPQPVPVEIKSGQTISRDAFKGLDYFNKLSGGTDSTYLIAGGDESYTRQSVRVTSWRDIGGIGL